MLANQKENGAWEGSFGHADTAFALLFLSKSNLVPGATERLKGQLRDPGPLQILQKKEAPEKDAPPPGDDGKTKKKAPPAKPDPEALERAAAEKLKAAQAALQSGNLELAKVRLQNIIDDFPTTQAALQAEKLLVEVAKKLKQKGM